MKKAAGEGYATATDLADWLVRDAQYAVPAGASHHRVASSAEASKAGVPLHRVPLEAMQAIEPKITDEVFKVLSVDRVGAKPRQLWRHRAEECPAAGQAVVETAGKRPVMMSMRWSEEISPCSVGLIWSAPVEGCFFVTRGFRLPYYTPVLPPLALLSAARLGLSACGRKGPLDAPPAGSPRMLTARWITRAIRAADEIDVQTQGKSKRLPIIRGPNRPIPLDRS